MKRICIYLTYDQQKIVDGYIGYMLKELKTCVDYLAVVCNETEVIRGNEILKEYADKIFYRENIGFDAGGFKDALFTYLGWERVLQYDELVLVNDSLFGPFRPMVDIFSEMEKNPVDFWGMAKHGATLSDAGIYKPELIQSYFLVIRSRMLHSFQFQKFWENVLYYKTLEDTVEYYEKAFTPYFAKLGYTYDAVADTRVNDSKNIANNYIQYENIPYELIKLRNFPVLKRKPMVYETLSKQTQENLRRVIDYIDQFTDYDVRLIWENIIRTSNMTDLQKSLHLQYIISPESRKHVDAKAVILVCIAHRESAEYVLEYLHGIPSKYSIEILAESEEYLEDYRIQGYNGYITYDHSLSEILMKFSDYEFICVIHDTDMTSDQRQSCTGKSYFYNLWENLIKDEGHISGILDQFVKEPFLGFLASPQPNFANFFGEYGREWNDKYEKVYEIIKKQGLYCRISEFKPPFRVTNDFWVRGSIVKKLWKIEQEEELYLPYLWTYLSQDAGYYSGIVESVDYASMNEVNMQYYLQMITSQVRKQCGQFNNFFEFERVILSCALERFCGSYSTILVYGVGEMATNYKKLFPKVNAYVVSDGQTKPENFEGYPVKYLSEVREIPDCGIILCLNKKNQMQVIPLLKTYGINNYFCI